MRRHAPLKGALVALVPLLFACTEVPTSADVESPASDALRRQLVAEGFPAQLIVEAGDNFIVDGDIVIRKRDVAARSGQIALGPRTAQRQYIHSRRLGGSFQFYASINTTGLTGASDWAEAARQAIAEYNALSGHGLLYVEKNDATANTKTNTFYEPGSRVAYAYLPKLNGQAGDSLVVNTYYNFYSLAQKKLVIMHELGHNIGFVHADWQSAGGTSGALIVGTPEDDFDSYMRSSIGGIPWTSFPYYDKAAMRRVYPGKGPDLTPFLSGGHAVLSWNAVPDAERYDVYLITKAQDEQTGLWIDTYHDFVGSTTSASFVDYGRTWSVSTTPCDGNNSDPAYSVQVIFPTGAYSFGSGFGAACFH